MKKYRFRQDFQNEVIPGDHVIYHKLKYEFQGFGQCDSKNRCSIGNSCFGKVKLRKLKNETVRTFCATADNRILIQWSPVYLPKELFEI